MRMNVMVLGVTGMLGHVMFRVLSEHPGIKVYGTARHEQARQWFSPDSFSRIISGVHVENHDALVRAFAQVRPDVVMNCVGLVKQLAEANNPLRALPINAMLPHQLAALCQATGARLIHISTDCVFSGSKGGYVETDFPDADDLYGRTKLLGEVDYPNSITLRTSMIGHELSGHHSLVNWFLSQEGSVKGFNRAIFSGLPTVEMATLIRDIVLPREELQGVYHIASEPINKYDLLRMVADQYGKVIEITPSEDLVVDRSLNADKFNRETGYVPSDWPTLIQSMHAFHSQS